MSFPDLNRVPGYFHNYIKQVKQNDLAEAFTKGSKEFIGFMEQIPVEKRGHRYAEGKWSIQELLQHIIDTERVFAYRAMRFARKDATPLPSFDENEYAMQAHADTRDWNQMMEEFKALRRSTELMFASFNPEQLEASGTASGLSNYVLGWGFITVGHCLHHMHVIRERYL